MEYEKVKLEDFINPKWLDAESLRQQYSVEAPFPHIVMDDFIEDELVNAVYEEFPDLHRSDSVSRFQSDRESKYASEGMSILSPAAQKLTFYLSSDIFLNWLNALTSIREPLISDPYLSGGGYHEIKTGGFLKIHADFNKHYKLDLDRRLNLLIYMNRDWRSEWGGDLQLYDREMRSCVKSVMPIYNRAVIFTTTSYTYHGHPDPISCPPNISRKSLAYYYFSTGRPEEDVIDERHSTLFKKRRGTEDSFRTKDMKYFIKRMVPPIIYDLIKRS